MDVLQDMSFMQQALSLAQKGYGLVEPNPMVGCILVRDGQILGRGFHRRFGGPHAEIEAIMDALQCDEAAARNSEGQLAGATAYVTLEPCNHTGKTPPCTEALIAAGISRVVAAMEDPDLRVAGRGLNQLRQARMDVAVGCEEAMARNLLRAYIKLQIQKRPWVILKWAQTGDGFWNLSPGAGGAISGDVSRQAVQELRAGCDAIAVGIGAVLADDPLLTNRAGFGKTPTRIVLDAHLRTPLDSQLVQTASETPLLIAADRTVMTSPQAESLQAAGVELLRLPKTKAGLLDITTLLNNLGQRKHTRLLVEGGPTLTRNILQQKLADEIHVFVSPKKLNPPTDIAGQLAQLDVADIPDPYYQSSEQSVGEDTLLIFRKSNQE